MVVGVVVVALGGVMVVKLHCRGGWGGIGGTIGLICSPTYAYMYFFVNLVKKLDSSWNSYIKYFLFPTYPHN